MNVEMIREYALQLGNVTEGFPFGADVVVFKVNNKIFLLLPLEGYPLRFNAKCDPEKAIELREAYPGIILPGYHMNKKHWNTVIVGGNLPQKIIMGMIDNSYALVAKVKVKNNEQ